MSRRQGSMRRKTHKKGVKSKPKRETMFKVPEELKPIKKFIEKEPLMLSAYKNPSGQMWLYDNLGILEKKRIKQTQKNSRNARRTVWF